MAESEAIILAGGFGSRLQGVVKDVPKPMADINGTPFLSLLMNNLSEQGVNKVLLSVGYKYEVVMSHFGSRYKNLNIQYVIEGMPLGTGGAIKKAMQHIRGEEFFVLNGDSLCRIDLNSMRDFHNKSGADITVAVKPMRNIERYGTLEIDKDRIIGFQGRTFKEAGYINCGVYMLNKNIFRLMPSDKEPFSFETDFLEKACAKLKIQAFFNNAYFIDIGIIEDYERAKKELG